VPPHKSAELVYGLEGPREFRKSLAVALPAFRVLVGLADPLPGCLAGPEDAERQFVEALWVYLPDLEELAQRFAVACLGLIGETQLRGESAHAWGFGSRRLHRR
jgi:hypothetical protein